MKKHDNFFEAFSEALNFFRTETGELAFFEKCQQCQRPCKQSWRVKEVRCRKFKPVENPDISEMENPKKS